MKINTMIIEMCLLLKSSYLLFDYKRSYHTQNKDLDEMNKSLQPPIHLGNLRILLVAIALGVLAYPFSASAALGEDITSVQADQALMQGSLITIREKAYTVNEIKSPSGIVVREYVSPGGKIFAVAWQGPFIPNFRQLFGTYFEQYSRAAQTRNSNRPRVRGPLLIREPGLVVLSGGHMRAFFGKAYVPEMVPQGVRFEEIQ